MSIFICIYVYVSYCLLPILSWSMYAYFLLPIHIYAAYCLCVPGAAFRCLLGPRLLSQPVPGAPERAETVDGA